MNNHSILTGLFAVACLASCSTSVVQTKETQSATTPAQAIETLRAGNERFSTGHSRKRDLVAQVRSTSGGQHPIAAVLGCIDSRVSPELIFDQGIGDLFGARVAGNVLNADVLGSLEFATAKSGAKAIVVLGHTRCGAVAGACSNADLGHLTGLLEKIKPAVRKVSASSPRGVGFEDRVAAEHVRDVVSDIRTQSPIIRKLEQQGKLTVRGAIYHLDTGRVEFLN